MASSSKGVQQELEEKEDDHDNSNNSNNNRQEQLFEFPNLDFDDLDLDLLITSNVIKVWHAFGASAAFLEFSAAILNEYCSSFIVDNDNEACPPICHVRWLRANEPRFGLAFSIIWAIDAFVNAHRNRIRTIRYLEERIILQDPSCGGNVCQVELWKAWFVWITVVFLQLILLPVGFYSFLFRLFGLKKAIFLAERNHGNHFLDPNRYFAQDESSPEFNHAVLMVTLNHFFALASKEKDRQIEQAEEHKKSGVKFLARFVLSNFVRNPFLFQRRVRHILTGVRWAKYLAPLVGRCNAIINEVKDIYKAIQQNRNARKAKEERGIYRHGLSKEELRNHCAVHIQSAYRGYRVRKKVLLFILIAGTTKYFAIKRVQMALRRALKRARLRIAKRIAQLKELQEKQRNNELTSVEQWDLYALRKEMLKKTSLILNKDLILRPDSRFAITWGAFVVLAVLAELIENAFKPTAAKHFDPATGERLSFQGYVYHTLVGKLVGIFSVCKEQEDTSNNIFRMLVRKLKKVPKVEVPKPWFCDKFYHDWLTWCQKLIGIVIYRFQDIVGIILFMDIFVTFFTGRIESKTGEVVPNSFFKRWVLPGLLLQLAVNPKLASVTQFLFSSTKALLRKGPNRVLKWAVAVLYPVLLVTVRSVKETWRTIVVSQNKNKTATTTTTTTTRTMQLQQSYYAANLRQQNVLGSFEEVARRKRSIILSTKSLPSV